MAEYLIDNPPRVRQFRRPRSQQPSGVIVVHTAESFPDETAPDTGAENVARFIRDRTTPGSYHDLADSDSIVFLVPYDAEAFGDGTGSNPHAYHVSAATQAHKWDQLDDGWVDDCVRNMAKASARYARWLKARRGITIPARRITRAQSDARMPGFISHAERDPNRRTDPGAGFPWTKYLNYYAAEMSGEEEIDMGELHDHGLRVEELFGEVKEQIHGMGLRIEAMYSAEVARDLAEGERDQASRVRVEHLFRTVLTGQGATDADVDEVLVKVGEVLAKLNEEENPS